MGQYIRHATTTIEEVISKVRFYWGGRRAKAVLESGHEVGVASLRLKTFAVASTSKKGIHCKACGLRAEYFAVESFSGSEIQSYHVNLYAMKDNNEVLFTQDHVLPKSRGGKDNLNNSQVMCQPCNSRKGSRSDRKFKLEMRGSK
jgi:hypothetical protein